MCGRVIGQQPEAFLASGTAPTTAGRQIDVGERQRFRHRSHRTFQQRRRRMQRPSAGSIHTHPQSAQSAILQRFLLRRAGKSASEQNPPAQFRPFRACGTCVCPSGRNPCSIGRCVRSRAHENSSSRTGRARPAGRSPDPPRAGSSRSRSAIDPQSLQSEQRGGHDAQERRRIPQQTVAQDALEHQTQPHDARRRQQIRTAPNFNCGL